LFQKDFSNITHHSIYTTESPEQAHASIITRY